MFEQKKKSLFESSATKAAATADKNTQINAFLNAGVRKAAETRSGNDALKYFTTGNEFVDQFGKLGSYKEQRSFADVSRDMSILWAKNPFLTVCFTLFIRMITRVVSFFDGSKTLTPQRGAGLRHEGILRMIWLHLYHKDTFWKNIHLFIVVGGWRDIIAMLSYDLQYNGWTDRQLDWDYFGKLILAGLENPNTTNLVRKWLPQIKSNNNCKTISAQADNVIAKWICSLLYGSKEENTGKSYKLYRKLKSSGTAHQWQQLISQNRHDLIDFNTIHGRALALLVSSKYLSNQGLEKKYEQWIEAQPVAKFTGYPHELFQNIRNGLKVYQEKTIDAQFMQLVEVARKNIKDATSMIVVRDTSGSMSSTATGTTMACGDIAKALALFFSYLLPEGHFSNAWIEFNADAKMHKWQGSTPTEKWKNDGSNYVGSTFFLSVIHLFCRIKESGVAESEFPSGIICISDGEFNPAHLNITNVSVAFQCLKSAGFSQEYLANFKIVLWNLQSRFYGPTTGQKFETYGNVDNVYYFSGYDGSIVSFLTGSEDTKSTPKNAEELFMAAMEQEIMQRVVI